MSRCSVAGCRVTENLEQHHILYPQHQGGPVTRPLCHEHHEWITAKQGYVARKQHHELSARQRWYFWFQLIGGKIKKPRRTRRHLDWWQGPIDLGPVDQI